MAKRSVFTIAPNRATADRIVHELKVAGYANTEISVLFLVRPHARVAGASTTPERSEAVAPAPSSTEIRGVIAWIDGARSVVIPGVEPLIAAGPIAIGLTAKTVGGIAGGLGDFGVPDTEAARYEHRINEGAILVGVHSENPEAGARARDLFGEAGGEAMFTMMQVTTPRTVLHHGLARAGAA